MIEQIENQEMVRELMKNKIIAGAISVILVILFAKIILSLLRKLINKLLDGKMVQKSNVSIRKVDTISKAIYSVIRVIIIFIAVTMILDIFGINTSTLIATAGVGGVAIALGTQTLIADFIKGILIILDDKIRVGEWVKIAGVEGEVEALDFRVTKLRDFDGSLHIIPNSEISTVQNYNRGFMVSETSFSVSYDTSLKEIKDLVEKVSKDLLARKEYKNAFDEEFEIFEIKDLNDFSYKVRIIASVKAGLQWEIARQARTLIKEEMERRKIKSSLVRWDKNEEI